MASDTSEWPVTVYIIRHGEKPDSKNNPPGLDRQGSPSAGSLIAQGWQRAAGLAVIFGGDPYTRSPFLQPDALIAPQYGKTTKDADERRPSETIEPLCELLNLIALDAGKPAVTIEHPSAIDDHKGAFDAITGSGVGTVLVAWEHTNIRGIAEALTKGAGAAIPEWPGTRFDLVWIFTLNDGKYMFSQLPQLLLASDLDSIVPVDDQPTPAPGP